MKFEENVYEAAVEFYLETRKPFDMDLLLTVDSLQPVVFAESAYLHVYCLKTDLNIVKKNIRWTIIRINRPKIYTEN